MKKIMNSKRKGYERFKDTASIKKPLIKSKIEPAGHNGNNDKVLEIYPTAATPPASFHKTCSVEIANLGSGIGQTLKALRRVNRLTQEELAKRALVDRTTIARLECGIIKSLAVQRLESIAHVFGIDLQTFLLKAHSAGDAMCLRTQVNRVEFLLEYPEEGFRIISFVPHSQEFFFGKIEIRPQKIAPSSKLPHTHFIYVHVLDGMLVLTRLGNSVVLKPGDCHMIPGSEAYELYNPELLKSAQSLFITHPSFLIS